MTYGSLAVWSTQGMEKSHYVAKTSFVKHSQHNGTSLRHSAIVQSFQWWYRVIQHREIQRKRKEARAKNPVILAVEAAAEKRRQTSNLSTTNARHAKWKKGCVRIGSQFIPSVSEVDTQPII